MAWSIDELAKFFKAFDDYWPGRMILGRDSEMMKAWRDVAQRFSPSVAMASLRDLFEGQTTPRVPTLAGFKSVAMPMQNYVMEKARQAELARERGEGEELFNGREIARDEAFWQRQFERHAGNPAELERQKRMREYLRNGGPIRGLIAAAAGNSRWGQVPPEREPGQDDGGPTS